MLRVILARMAEVLRLLTKEVPERGLSLRRRRTRS
jgi:hypothetical protein